MYIGGGPIHSASLCCLSTLSYDFQLVRKCIYLSQMDCLCLQLVSPAYNYQSAAVRSMHREARIHLKSVIRLAELASAYLGSSFPSRKSTYVTFLFRTAFLLGRCYKRICKSVQMPRSHSGFFQPNTKGMCPGGVVTCYSVAAYDVRSCHRLHETVDNATILYISHM